MSYPTLLLCVHFPHKRAFEFASETFDATVIFLLSGGSFAWEFAGHSGTAGSGDAVICPPGCEFRRRVIEPVDLYVLRFSGCHDLPPVVRFAASERIRRDLEFCPAHPSKREFTAPERHFLTDIPFALADIAGLFARERAVCSDALMSSAAEYIRHHCGEALSVERLAADFGFTPAALIRRFRRAVGETPGRYLIRMRMELAAELLAASDYTIPEIAARCGYRSEFYFMNSVRKFHGVTAAEYRAKNRIG